MELTKKQKGLIADINRLKKKKNAVILVHNYQRPEIYEVADFIGDSLMLCQEAQKTDAKLIVFCGVSFMAESAKILNPEKKVIMPFIDAGCAMADMVDVDALKEFRQKHPKAVVVTYINSNAEVKAISDVICTSSNAAKVIKALKEKEIIFVPDKNLAAYVQKQVPEKKIIPWAGFCPVHNSLTEFYLKQVQKEYPKAKILAHPECRPEVLAKADYVTSTSGMIEAARESSAKEFFVLTECGMVERLAREVPNKKFYGLCNMCFDMKKNTLESILRALQKEDFVVELPPGIMKKAKWAFDRMFELTKNYEQKSVK